MSQKLPNRLKGMDLTGRRNNTCRDMVGWVIAGGNICRSAEKNSKKSGEESRVPHGKGLIRQF